MIPIPAYSPVRQQPHNASQRDDRRSLSSSVSTSVFPLGRSRSSPLVLLGRVRFRCAFQLSARHQSRHRYCRCCENAKTTRPHLCISCGCFQIYAAVVRALGWVAKSKGSGGMREGRGHARRRASPPIDTMGISRWICRLQILTILTRWTLSLLGALVAGFPAMRAFAWRLSSPTCLVHNVFLSANVKCLSSHSDALFHRRSRCCFDLRSCFVARQRKRMRVMQRCHHFGAVHRGRCDAVPSRGPWERTCLLKRPHSTLAIYKQTSSISSLPAYSQNDQHVFNILEPSVTSTS